MKTLVCGRRDMNEFRYVVPNSVPAECDRCRIGLWMSPSSLAVREPGDEVLCLQCFKRASAEDGEGIELIPLTDWQRRELRAAGIDEQGLSADSLAELVAPHGPGTTAGG